jgi:hypothetical protein
MQRLNRFARYWDLVANSGRFTRSLPLLLGESPFARFMAFSDWLYATTGKTHELALERLMDWVVHWCSTEGAVPKAQIEAAITQDYQATGAKGKLAFMKRGLSVAGQPNAGSRTLPPRQQRHLENA